MGFSSPDNGAVARRVTLTLLVTAIGLFGVIHCPSFIRSFRVFAVWGLQAQNSRYECDRLVVSAAKRRNVGCRKQLLRLQFGNNQPIVSFSTRRRDRKK